MTLRTEARDLRRQGMTLYAIVAQLGAPYATVQYWIRGVARGGA